MQSLFYFHTLGTAHLILEHGTIRARHFSCLNDRDEFSFGLKVLEKHFKTARPMSWSQVDIDAFRRALKPMKQPGWQLMNASFHPVCFTMNNPLVEKDSQPHFLAYSHDGGVALEVELPDDLSGRPFSFVMNGHWSDEDYYRVGSTAPQVEKVSKEGPVIPIGDNLLKIHYQPSSILTKSRLAKTNLANLPPLPKGNLQAYALQIKRSAFEGEQEQRYIFDSESLNGSSTTPSPWLGYMDLDGTVSSFLDIGYSSKDPSSKKLIKGWPIVSVTAAPGRLQDRVYRDLRKLLESNLKIQPMSSARLLANAESCLSAWMDSWNNGDFMFPLGERPKKTLFAKELRQTKNGLALQVAGKAPSLARKGLSLVFERLGKLFPTQVDLLERNCYFVRSSGLLLRRSELPLVW